MSRINDFINNLCPNGVEYRFLKNVSTMQRGQSITSKELSDGNIPVIAGGQEPSYYNDKSNREGETITVSGSGAYAGFVNYWNEPILCTDSFSIKTDNMNTKFLFHYLKMNQREIYNKKKGAGIPHVHISDLENMKIPVPPIEIQEEIVRILDKFGELEAELEAELEVRKSQYEFWRGKLLEDSKDKVKFGDIATIVRGGSPRPIQNFITTDDNSIPWIKIGDTNPNDKYVVATKEKITVDGSKKSRFVKAGDFILSNSMSFGRPYILKIDGCIHDGWLSISNFEDTYIPDFLYHLLSSKPIQDTMSMKASIGTVKNLNADIVKSIELPLYTKVEQEKIVRILDKFEELTNDISVGLPAEIELRRKQYEYYRNKLLSFEELSVSE